MCDCYKVTYADDVDDERTEYHRCETHKAEERQLAKRNADLYLEMKRIREEMDKVLDAYKKLDKLLVERFVEEE